MKNLTWLASYPRSGNTWLRIFLANWLADQDVPVKINELPIYGLGFQDSDPLLWKFVTGEEIPSESVQIARRAEVQRSLPQWARNLQGGGTGEHYLVKTHCFFGNVNGHPTIAEDRTFRSVYLIRDPRDVAVSVATFADMSLDAIVELMADAQAKIGTKQPLQFLSTWSNHVWSWQRIGLVVRYEDLPGAFAQITHYLGLGVDPKKLEKCVRFSQMPELRAQEDRGGFREAKHGRFFGAKHRTLPKALEKRIEKDHEGVMRAYGYLR